MRIYPVDEAGQPIGDNDVGSGYDYALRVRSRSEKGVSSDIRVPKMKTEITPVRLMVDGSYLKLFGGEQRVANIPNADLGRSNRLRFDFDGVDETNPTLLKGIRIAAGGREMLYDRLVRDGRVVTGGILFETGSARLLPESTPTLNDLVQALNQDPAMRVRIEGHTDNVGQADFNQRLSEDRARAVVEYLTTSGGIAAERLEAVGMGQAQPAADNTTPEGRQTNRRVEVAVIR
jgi:outer membrane protein OmpA-like peptidoglycan-associated protein